MSKLLDVSILCCPKCHADSLDFSKCQCSHCGNEFAFDKNKYIFTKFEVEDVTDKLDKLKFFLKQFPKAYNFLIYLISPVFSDGCISRFVKKYPFSNQTIGINLGSGSSDIHPSVSNVDIFNYKSVDLVCDISELPIKNISVDVVFNIAVLEHVPDPEKIVSEIYRVLKLNGEVLCFFPFIQAFHASPYDFSRRTIEGMKVLFKDFEIIELKPSGGPTSGFLWVFQEWLAMILSFGFKPLYTPMYLLIMTLTFPLKYLDLILIHHPMANQISSGFLIHAKKREVLIHD